jgi:hypothetical protein
VASNDRTVNYGRLMCHAVYNKTTERCHMLQLSPHFPQDLNASSTSNLPYISFHMYNHSVHAMLVVISFANDKRFEIADMPDENVGQGHQPFIFWQRATKLLCTGSRAAGVKIVIAVSPVS